MSDLQQSLDILVSRARAKTLGTIKPADPLPSLSKSAAAPAAAASTPSGGGGVASPFTETAARTYHATRSVMSSDGVFVLKIKPIHTLNMTDANSAAVQLILANP